MTSAHCKERHGRYIALTLAVLLAISVASGMLAAPRSMAAETYTWSQPDWSGGAGQGVTTGTTNRYDSDNGNVDVSAPGKVLLERAIYFDSEGREGGHATIGAAAADGKWYMPEGYTGGDFDTWLLMQNPREERASVKVSFMREDGEVVELDYSLAPRSRETVHLNDVEGLADAMVSTAVESTNGVDVVCERSMYFDFNGRSGGHNSIGASSGSTWMASLGEELPSKWCMSEGSAGSGFNTYVLVQNPSDEAAHVRFTYMTSTGDTLTEECELPPRSRYTRCLSDVEGLESDAVSTQVESLDGVPIVCERSVYFDFAEFVGGHDSIGYALTD